ncbi:hypothetical protein Q5P01_011458 [Channa striata]|uniref:Uncharacterized protein n=1 Tax=Channa striata TaxID=64152 RepID=A0AA88SVP9_CHASR|nr:hypothetical protein Q5P01_011458 [Channa striata]
MMLKTLCCVFLVALTGLLDLGVNAQNCTNVNQWNVTISGPDTVVTGKLSQFTCLTSCILNGTCTVSWDFNGGFPSGSFSAYKNVFNWTPSIAGIIQKFTCVAENANGCSAQTTKMVKVIADVTPTNPPTSGSEAQLLSFGTILSLGLLVSFDL